MDKSLGSAGVDASWRAPGYSWGDVENQHRFIQIENCTSVLQIDSVLLDRAAVSGTLCGLKLLVYWLHVSPNGGRTMLPSSPIRIKKGLNRGWSALSPSLIVDL